MQSCRRKKVVWTRGWTSNGIQEQCADSRGEGRCISFHFIENWNIGWCSTNLVIKKVMLSTLLVYVPASKLLQPQFTLSTFYKGSERNQIRWITIIKMVQPICQSQYIRFTKRGWLGLKTLTPGLIKNEYNNVTVIHIIQRFYEKFL